MNHFGLIGYPLAHSFSPAYFKDKFQRERLADYRYEAFPLSAIKQLPELLEQHPDLWGFNVTIPYKEQIIPYLDEIDEAAREIGAVNCVKILREDIGCTRCVPTRGCKKNYRLKGYNTDAPAFAHCLQEGWELPNKEMGVGAKRTVKALVFGTGGAAKAVAYALRQLNIDFYFVSRSKQDERTIAYTDLIHSIRIDNQLENKNMLKDCKLWINATPVGMYPHTEETLPLDFSVIDNEHYLFDLIYNPEETVFLRQGRLHGAHTQNGLAMLHEQAELSWKIFNNLSNY
jgi:shikimate dehydrogenase